MPQMGALRWRPALCMPVYKSHASSITLATHPLIHRRGLPVLQLLPSLLIGDTPRLRRVMAYWAATAFIYTLSALIVLRESTRHGGSHLDATLVAIAGVGGIGVFYFLLRGSQALGIPHWRLAVGQAYYAVLYNMALYAALGDLRGAILIGLPVVIVFCAFALRPAQTIALSGFAIAALCATSAGLMWWRPASHPLETELVHVCLASFGVASVAAINSELSRLRVPPDRCRRHHPPPGHHGRADPAGQPPPHARAAGTAGTGARTPQRPHRSGRPGLPGPDRHRFFQGHQRPPRPRGRRHGAQSLRPGRRGHPARGRCAGPLGRRGISAADARHRPARGAGRH